MIDALREEVAALEAEVSQREGPEDAAGLAEPGAACVGAEGQHQARAGAGSATTHSPPSPSSAVLLSWVGLRPPLASTQPAPLDGGRVEQGAGRKQAQIANLIAEIAALDAQLMQAGSPDCDDASEMQTHSADVLDSLTNDLATRVASHGAGEGVYDNGEGQEDWGEEEEEEEEEGEVGEGDDDDDDEEDSNDDEATQPEEDMLAWLAGEDSSELQDTISSLPKHAKLKSKVETFPHAETGVADTSMVKSAGSSEAPAVPQLGRETSWSARPSLRASRKIDPPYDFAGMRVLGKPLTRLTEQKNAVEMHEQGVEGEHADPDFDLPTPPRSRMNSLDAANTGADRNLLGRLVTGSKIRGSKTRSSAENAARSSHEHELNSRPVEDDAMSMASVTFSIDDNATKDTGGRRKSILDLGRIKLKRSGSRRSLKSVGSTTSSIHENDDEEEDKSTRSLRVYRNAAAVLALFLVDLILFIVLEIAWTDSVCAVYASPAVPESVRAPTMQSGSLPILSNSSAASMSEGELVSQPDPSVGAVGEVLMLHRIRWEIVTLKGVIAVLYLIKIYTVMRKTQRVVNQQYSCSSFLSRPFLSLWALFFMVLVCLAMLVAEGVECMETSEDVEVSNEVQLLQRLKVLRSCVLASSSVRRL